MSYGPMASFDGRVISNHPGDVAGKCDACLLELVSIPPRAMRAQARVRAWPLPALRGPIGLCLGLHDG